MANRNMGNQVKTNLAAPYVIDFFWTQLAAAPGGVQVFNDGNTGLVTSVTRTGAGLFDVVLADNYTQFFSCSIMVVAAAANLDLYGQLDLAFNMAAAGGATLSIRLKTGAGNADPADDDIVMVRLTLSNSSLNP
jgi:hypothetical protein